MREPENNIGDAARRGLLLATPFGAKGERGLLLSDLDGAHFTLDLEDKRDRERAASLLSSPDRVFAFPRAQPALRALLDVGAACARVFCGYTVSTLLGEERPVEQKIPLAQDTARERLSILRENLTPWTDAIKAHPHRAVARLECLALPVFAAMERRGLPLDKASWQSLVDEAKREEKSARAELFAALGDSVPRDLFGEPDLNLDNDVDVKAALERLLGQPLPGVTKAVLSALEHPAAGALLRFREHHKVVTTYGDAFLAHVDDDGRVRASFIPLGASTGRVASREPNLQNLPSSARFHQCVRAREGRALVTADYATAELRILAELSEDPVFLEAFVAGEDLHSRVAQEIFKQPVSKTENPALRARAKAINFGLCYGMGAAALGASVGVNEHEAQKLLDDYFRAFPKIRGYLEGSVDKALQRGFAETKLGRRLVFDEETVRGPNARGELSRIAKNMPIQGTSADMAKLAMVRVHERLQREHVRAGLVNMIHDELVVECEASEGDAVAAAVREEMSAAHNALIKHVPAEVDVHVGEHWVH